MNHELTFGKRFSCLAVFALCFLLTAAAGGQESVSRRAVTIDDYFRLARVGEPRVSPDQRWVAYTLTRADLKKDEKESRIWMVPLAGGEALPMTAPGYSASEPRWSPDGKYLAFLAERNEGKTQVWGLNRLGGEAQQLTFVKQGVESYRWSPDGQRLLLIIKDPKPEDLEKKKEEKEKPRPWVIDRLQFKRDYAGYLDHRRTHLYLNTPGDSTLTQLTFGDFDDSQPVWSPDGREVAFVSNRSDNPDGNDNRDIWLVTVSHPDSGRSLRQLTTNPGADYEPAWSPDGRFISYVTVTRPELIWYATNHLAVISSSGGAPQVLTEAIDRNVSSPRFSPDGKSIYFILEDAGQQLLARIDRNGEDLRRLVSGVQVVEALDFINDRHIALLVSTPDRPEEVFLWEGGRPRRLTSANDELLEQVRLATVEKVRFPSADGTAIEGFIYSPAEEAVPRPLPTILRIHGGPVSQYDYRFNFDAQLFCANGYRVIMVNPRGSSGYGQDFSMAIYQDWGNKDFEDVMAAVDYAVQQRLADPQRLGVGGWSYGGILTNYVITKTERFKAAISGASEVLYAANYGHDHYQYEWEAELGLPWENRELWERLSPFNSVEKIVTPTLIMGGEVDWNVPIQNSEQLYQALRRLGRTTELVVYPGQSHGISRPSFQKDRFQRYIDWYDRFLKR